MHGDLTTAMFNWAKWTPDWQRKMKQVLCQLYLKDGPVWEVFENEMLGGFKDGHERQHGRIAEIWVPLHNNDHPQDAITEHDRSAARIIFVHRNEAMVSRVIRSVSVA